MKNSNLKVSCFIVILVLVFQSSFSQSYFNFTITGTKHGNEITATELFEKNNPNNDKPTILITWSYIYCGSNCTDLINRYNIIANTKKINLIIVNVDKTGGNGATFKDENQLKKVLTASRMKWKNADNYYAYNKSKIGGLGTIFNVTSTPMILSFDKNNKLNIALASYNFHPFRYYVSGIEKNDLTNLLWESPEDLIDLAEFIASNKNSLDEQFLKALNYIERAENLIKEKQFNIDFYYTEHGLKDNNPDILIDVINYKKKYTKALLLNKIKKNKEALKIIKNVLDELKELEFYYWSFHKKNYIEKCNKLMNKIIDEL